MNSSIPQFQNFRIPFFGGVPAIAVGLSAISFSASLQKDAAPIPNASEAAISKAQLKQITPN